MLSNSSSIAFFDTINKHKREKYFRDAKCRIVLCGGSGAGKSSTINRICGKTLARAEFSPDPVTSQFQLIRYTQEILLLDTPGLGDSPNADQKRLKNIEKLFVDARSHADCCINRLLLITDINSRDLSSIFTILKSPAIQKARFHFKLIIGVNQMDLCEPDLIDLRVNSIRKRIKLAFPCFKRIKIIPFSAKTGENLHELIKYFIPLKFRRKIVST